MENTSPEERIRQLLLRIGCDDHNRAVFRLYGALCLMDIKLHLIQLPEQIVGKFQIGLVDLVNEQNHLLL